MCLYIVDDYLSPACSFCHILQTTDDDVVIAHDDDWCGTTDDRVRGLLAAHASEYFASASEDIDYFDSESESVSSDESTEDDAVHDVYPPPITDSYSNVLNENIPRLHVIEHPQTDILWTSVSVSDFFSVSSMFTYLTPTDIIPYRFFYHFRGT